MSFLGMGPMEIMLILLLAFIFLGPERMVDAAKAVGRLVREGRKLASELPQVVLEEDDIKIVNSPGNSRPPQPTEDAGEKTPTEEDGPVAHKPSPPPPPEPSQQDSTGKPPAT